MSSLLQLRPILVGSSTILPTVNVICPADTYALPANPGSYRIRVTLPGVSAIGSFPMRYLEPATIVVDSTDVAQDITVRPGVPILGGGTVDGVPAPFVNLISNYADFPLFASGSATSNASGLWEEAFGRVPLILQPGVDLNVSGCFQFAGTTLVEGFPAGAVNFSGPASINCTMATGQATAFTHSATPLAASILPGDIGGLSSELSPELGLGYGVQFPVIAPATPRPLPIDLPPLQLFRGGLILGVNGTRILSGVDQSGVDVCLECRDFGPGAVGAVEDLGGGNRRITWTYDDSHSSERVGINVFQESFDGVAGSSYVLIRFAFTNTSGQRLVLDPGLFMDWDIEGDPLSELGATNLAGQLMYETNRTGGSALGTMIFAGGPSRGGYFFPFLSPMTSIQDQLAILRGDLRRPSVDRGDTHYLQGGSRVKLEVGETKDIWVAVIGGSDVAALLANGRTAAADVATRKNAGVPITSRSELGRMTTVPTVARPSPAWPVCKKSCDME
ncbi:MAG: hypothetical protein ABI679_01690 [Gemmatimonadota bacterium]